MKRLWLCVLGVVFAVMAAGCVADVGETVDYTEDVVEEPIEETEQAFKAKDFNVTIEVPLRGPGPGGWQTAFGYLEVRPGIKCTVRVQMPIRSHDWGDISKHAAAQISADIATKAQRVRAPLHPKDYFCAMWRKEMKQIIEAPPYKTLGGRVTKN